MAALASEMLDNPDFYNTVKSAVDYVEIRKKNQKSYANK
jgi:hypothetical protein